MQDAPCSNQRHGTAEIDVDKDRDSGVQMPMRESRQRRTGVKESRVEDPRPPCCAPGRKELKGVRIEQADGKEPVGRGLNDSALSKRMRPS